MTDTQPTIEQEVERYLRTGNTDPHHTAWPGGFLESAQRAHNARGGGSSERLEGHPRAMRFHPPSTLEPLDF